MTKDVVIVYFSRLAPLLQAHERATLTAVAKSIAKLKHGEFGGCYHAQNDLGATFFVPDDTLIRDEAVGLDIRGPQNLFGGVVPYPFSKTKAISHGLIANAAAQPEGWSPELAAKLRDAVLWGYTVFSARDARIATKRMLAVGPIRVKPPLATGGRAQRAVSTIGEIDAFLEQFQPDEFASYGLVLEENLRDVRTLSVGQITVNGMMMTYYGSQRSARDNEGRSVYGGSELVCMRGGWNALERLPLTDEVRTGIAQAKIYDDAMAANPDFFASRRNYDIGQGVNAAGRFRSGVFEASWRVGGASTAEVAAIGELQQDPTLQIVEAMTVKEFGNYRDPPRHAAVHFSGDDPQEGPMIRYTLVTNRLKGGSHWAGTHGRRTTQHIEFVKGVFPSCAKRGGR